MRPQTIGAIWLFGLVLAAALYAVGPDRFVQAGLDLADHAQAAMADLAAALTVGAFELMRALAIALFVVFLVLGVLAAQRGIRSRRALVLVSVLFLACVFDRSGAYGAAGGHWLGAFALAAVGAAVMTRRLIHPAPRDLPRDPWASRPL
jgi:hypothetical protein